MAHTLTHGGGHVRAHHNDDGTHIDDAAAYGALQRERYGGLNFGAAFFGWIVAMGISVLLIALLAAAGSAIALTTINVPNVRGALSGETAQTIGLVGGALLLLALAIAYYAGGYVAGRMSRFNGIRQGLGVWAIGLIITILLGILGVTVGAQYNLLQNLNLPALPVNQSTFTTGGLVTSLLAMIITLLAAIFGGRMGERYHNKVDEAGVRD
jgi:amino acid transporter